MIFFSIQLQQYMSCEVCYIVITQFFKPYSNTDNRHIYQIQINSKLNKYESNKFFFAYSL